MERLINSIYSLSFAVYEKPKDDKTTVVSSLSFSKETLLHALNVNEP